MQSIFRLSHTTEENMREASKRFIEFIVEDYTQVERILFGCKGREGAVFIEERMVGSVLGEILVKKYEIADEFGVHVEQMKHLPGFIPPDSYELVYER